MPSPREYLGLIISTATDLKALPNKDIERFAGKLKKIEAMLGEVFQDAEDGPEWDNEDSCK